MQDILSSHANGERTRRHPHYLKSTVYCGTCGSRLLVEMSKSRSGVYYPYFMCGGRHSKRTDCRQKAVLISEVEERIEEHYGRVALDPEFRRVVEAMLLEDLKAARADAEVERQQMHREREKLERRRDKLMEAHYQGAVPVDLLKREQDRIADALLEIASRLKAADVEFEVVQRNLAAALELSENCALAYKTAPDHVRKLFNQAFFKRVLVYSDTRVEAELAPPFDVLLDGGLEATLNDVAPQDPQDTKEPTQSSGLLRKPTNSNRSALRHSVLSLAHGLSNTFMVGLTVCEFTTSWTPVSEHRGHLWKGCCGGSGALRGRGRARRGTQLP